MSIDTAKIRKDFPLFNRKINGNTPVYLDNAATSLKPKPVIYALNNYYKNLSSNIHRSANTLSHDASMIMHMRKLPLLLEQKTGVKLFLPGMLPNRLIWLLIAGDFRT